MQTALEPSSQEAIRSLEALEQEIGELSAQIEAATCRLLLCVSEFDRRQGWAAAGFRSCAHWLSFRVGWDLATAREHLRVGRALEELPLIRAAFAAGEVSYSKVRAISRVATPETEGDLLEVARHGTASHLERLSRLFRRASSAEERELACRQQKERYLKTWTDEEGMLCIRGRLPPEAGAVLDKALGEAMRAMGERPEATRDVSAEIPSSRSARQGPRSGIPASPLVPRAAAPELAPECEAETVEEALAEEETCEAVRGSFVPWGPSPRLRPMREVAPELRDQLRADALGLLCERALSAAALGQEAGGREGRFEVVLHVGAELLSGEAPVGRCEVEGGPRLPLETAQRLCCGSPLVTLLHGKGGELLGPGRRSRRISAPLWRVLRSRDETCAFPGCTARRGLVVHHVEHWAQGGETKLPNLICTCRAHHFALHEGGYRVLGRAPDALRFFTPEGKELPSRPLPLRAQGPGLAERNRAVGLSIGPATGLSLWQGERMDYGWAVETLLRRRRAS